MFLLLYCCRDTSPLAVPVVSSSVVEEAVSSSETPSSSPPSGSGEGSVTVTAAPQASDVVTGGSSDSADAVKQSTDALKQSTESVKQSAETVIASISVLSDKKQFSDLKKISRKFAIDLIPKVSTYKL